ncbi:hypothetical protein WS71_31215 [Burkholderia mayonis]|uniref:Uncharacterized protein n=1 Tax=Burkholderia mayonis TaxID=1385591 RepID=A0A1B4G6I1_9BURK|nr:hypothetical protein WS71_31215 [Burkholderia mayonis]KVE46499.1 hypothetical protein WS71_22375 [Burkholderia mayonis]
MPSRRIRHGVRAGYIDGNEAAPESKAGGPRCPLHRIRLAADGAAAAERDAIRLDTPPNR